LSQLTSPGVQAIQFPVTAIAKPIAAAIPATLVVEELPLPEVCMGPPCGSRRY
jgi:hypothetical protein